MSKRSAARHLLIGLAVALLLALCAFTAVRPVRQVSAGSIASKSDGHRIWHLSNPRHQFRVVRHRTPRPSHSPMPSPSQPQTSPTGDPSGPPTSTTPTDVPSTQPPTSDTPSSAAPSASPTDTPSDPPTPSDTPTPINDPGDGQVTADYPMPTGDLPGWRMVYSDDFAGSRLNTDTAWSLYNNGPVPSNPTTAYWSPSHVSVQDSKLTIHGAVDPSVSPDGRIVTEGLGLWKLPPQTYGKWEMLVRIDKCPQVKYAWLLWPYDGQWPGHGEIDFAEDEGGMRDSTVASVLYQGQNGAAATLPQNHLSPGRPMSDWHLVGVEWTPGSVKYTLDGKVWGTVDSNEVPSNPMTFVVQTESKVAPSQIPSDFTSCDAQIGWVVQYAMK